LRRTKFRAWTFRGRDTNCQGGRAGWSE
jgi:hypothetical protein